MYLSLYKMMLFVKRIVYTNDGVYLDGQPVYEVQAAS